MFSVTESAAPELAASYGPELIGAALKRYVMVKLTLFYVGKEFVCFFFFFFEFQPFHTSLHALLLILELVISAFRHVSVREEETFVRK